jgi:hypothetical protein
LSPKKAIPAKPKAQGKQKIIKEANHEEIDELCNVPSVDACSDSMSGRREIERYFV